MFREECRVTESVSLGRVTGDHASKLVLRTDHLICFGIMSEKFSAIDTSSF